MVYKKPTTGPEIVQRLVLPKQNELLAVLDKKMGYGRYNVVCSDGKERLARVPGSKKKGLWLHIGDFVIIKPWDVQGDIKCDIVYKYMRHMVPKLEAKGLLKSFESTI
jgi:translation initiation factor 1A